MRGKNNFHIGVDLLGNEGSPDALLEAILSLVWPSNLTLIFFGSKELTQRLKGSPHQLIPVTQAIEMEDQPLEALKKKKDSSLCRGIEMLRDKKLDAFVSAGNTGALMACAKLKLSMLPGISRPALLTVLPTKGNDLAVLDVGANVSCKAEQLVQFAAMGMAIQKSRGVQLPKIGLLNIGAEEIKGTPELRKAYQLLQNSRFKDSFVGNIEARQVFHGVIDVLVTDGFTGNVFLKTCEGIASVLIDEFEMRAPKARSSKLEVFFDTMRQRLHYAEYAGALLCGVRGLVMKCHGNASHQSFIRTIKEALTLNENSFLDTLVQYLNVDLANESTESQLDYEP